jgi:PleD family two-component response regulator
MRFNIISVDEYGLTKLEIANMVKDLNISILNAKDDVDVLSMLKDKKNDIHAIIWAFNKVDSDCFAAIKSLKSKEICKSIPIIIVSQFTDKSYIIKAIEAGAGEYIAKPYDETAVRKKICRILGIPSENSFMHTIDDDIITFNFSEMFSREIKSAARGNYAMTVLLVTLVIQDPKEVAEIDGLVQTLCRVLKTRFRETDSIFRYGTDSLIILLPFTDKSGAKVVEDKINDSFKSHSVLKQKNISGNLVIANVSYPDDGRIKDKLLEKLE